MAFVLTIETQPLPFLIVSYSCLSTHSAHLSALSQLCISCQKPWVMPTGKWGAVGAASGQARGHHGHLLPGRPPATYSHTTTQH